VVANRRGGGVSAGVYLAMSALPPHAGRKAAWGQAVTAKRPSLAIACS
jgi:hypothetical protein